MIRSFIVTAAALAAFSVSLFGSLADLLPAHLEDAQGNPVSLDALKGKTLGIYFSAEWCPPCRAFTPELVDFRNKNQDHFEVVFVSSDRTPEDQRKYMAGYNMNFLAVPHNSPAARDLRQRFQVQGIPQLGIVDEDGNIRKMDGRSDVAQHAETALSLWHEADPVKIAAAEPEPEPLFRGSLEKGDAMLEEGEFVRTHVLAGKAGEAISIDLRSDDFDTYLIVESPSGERWENDDGENGTDSTLNLVLQEDGDYKVHVTSFSPGETGDYRVLVVRTQLEEIDGVRFEGELAGGERRLKGGAFLRRHTFAGEAGDRIAVDLFSSQFDTYLILASPNGARWSNDDHEGNTSHSRVELELPETGEYTVYVSSLSAGETGDYRVLVSHLRPAR